MNRRASTRRQISVEHREREEWLIANRALQWNAAFPIGRAVRYFPVACNEAGFVDTVTRSEAWIMGGDQLVVMITGISGCVSCDHLRPLPPMAPIVATPPPSDPGPP